MAIPVLDDPVRRIFVVPLLLIPTLKATQDWSFTTGGVVMPRVVLHQRNERVLAWFGGTIYIVDDGAVGEAKPVLYAQDTVQHIELDTLTIRSDQTGRQSFLTGPQDLTSQLPFTPMVGFRACARSTVDGKQVSFFHLALTFMVQ